MARLDAVALNADWSTALNTSNGGMLDLAQFEMFEPLPMFAWLMKAGLPPPSNAGASFLSRSSPLTSPGQGQGQGGGGEGGQQGEAVEEVLEGCDAAAEGDVEEERSAFGLPDLDVLDNPMANVGTPGRTVS
jgi:hypothetical protein